MHLPQSVWLYLRGKSRVNFSWFWGQRLSADDSNEARRMMQFTEYVSYQMNSSVSISYDDTARGRVWKFFSRWIIQMRTEKHYVHCRSVACGKELRIEINVCARVKKIRIYRWRCKQAEKTASATRVSGVYCQFQICKHLVVTRCAIAKFAKKPRSSKPTTTGPARNKYKCIYDSTLCRYIRLNSEGRKHGKISLAIIKFVCSVQT